MKKVIALLLALMLMLGLVACGGEETTEPEGGEGEGGSSAPEGESSDSGEGQEAACGPRSWYAL